ncbi:hypothetical protein ACB092_01G278100 [Castanea dentata]
MSLQDVSTLSASPRSIAHTSHSQKSNVAVINHPFHSSRIVHTTTGAVRSKNKDKTTIGAVTSSHTSHSQQTRGKSIMSLQDVSTLSASSRSIAHTTTDTMFSSHSSSQTTGKSIRFAKRLSILAGGYSSPSTSSNSPWDNLFSVSRGYSSPSTFFNSPREKGVPLPSEKVIKKPTKLGSRLFSPTLAHFRRRDQLQNDYTLLSN